VIVKALKQFAPISTAVARSPAAVYVPPRFGSAAQKSDDPDISPLLTVDEHHRLQCLAGVLLYYCLAIDSTGLPVSNRPSRMQLRLLNVQPIVDCLPIFGIIRIIS
jgi:hypothetical protein